MDFDEAPFASMCVLILVLLCFWNRSKVPYSKYIVLSFFFFFLELLPSRLNIPPVFYWAQHENYIQENKSRGKNNVPNVPSLIPCQIHDRLKETACSPLRSLMMPLRAQAIHTVMTQIATTFSPLGLKEKSWLSNHSQ